MCTWKSNSKSHRSMCQRYSNFLPDKNSTNCPKCGKQFEGDRRLKKHIDIAHKEKNHKCNLCNRSFSDDMLLSAHVSSHKNDKTNEEKTIPSFNCNLCEESFQNLDLFKRHFKRNHFMFRKTQCEICNTQFAQALELTMHLKNGDGVYKCDFCSFTFLQKCAMPIHIDKCEKRSIQ